MSALRPPRACPSPTCALPADSCTDRTHKPVKKWDPGRGSKRERYGKDWERLRRDILRRDNKLCTACGAEATTVDHLVALAFGGTNDPDNLRSLCTYCHRRKTADDATLGRQRAAARRRGLPEPEGVGMDSRPSSICPVWAPSRGVCGFENLTLAPATTSQGPE